MKKVNLILGTMTFGESVFSPDVELFINTFLEAGYDENIVEVYDLLSGFIHFSKNGVIQSIVENTKDGFTAKIGATLPSRFNDVLLSIAKDSVHYYKLFHCFMAGAAERKREIDEFDRYIQDEG